MAAKIYMKESHINETQGTIYYESDWYETYFDTDDKPGKIFKSLQREFGRCVSKIYYDSDNGPLAVGYIFSKRCEYDDPMCRRKSRYYNREVWVELRTIETTEE